MSKISHVTDKIAKAIWIMRQKAKYAVVIVVLGACWGDEGKGKVVAFYTQQADLAIRATGGANAGHTIYINGKKIATHLIPSAIGNKRTICLIGRMVEVDIDILLDEINTVYNLGVEDVYNRLKIAGVANVTMPYHKALDKLQDGIKDEPVGTTGRGIGPTVESLVRRTGLKIYDLLLPVRELTKKIEEDSKFIKPLFDAYGKLAKNRDGDRIFTDEQLKEINDYFVHPEILAKKYHEYGMQLSSMVVDGQRLVDSYYYDHNKTIVVEGAQAIRLSIETGDYPMVTSTDSNTLGTLSGAFLPYNAPSEVIVCAKSHFTRVGQGVFPTEYPAHIDYYGRLIKYTPEEAYIGDIMRDDDGEYGASTGRPRRCGAADKVLMKNSVQVSGATAICLNCIDQEGAFGNKVGKLQICTKYKYQGGEIENFPSDINLTNEVPSPIYKSDNKAKDYFEGWTITPDMEEYDDLPENARRYIEFFEKGLGAPVRYIGTGPLNEDLIIRLDTF